jgi:hypothetical protein
MLQIFTGPSLISSKQLCIESALLSLLFTSHHGNEASTNVINKEGKLESRRKPGNTGKYRPLSHLAQWPWVSFLSLLVIILLGHISGAGQSMRKCIVLCLLFRTQML